MTRFTLTVVYNSKSQTPPGAKRTQFFGTFPGFSTFRHFSCFLRISPIYVTTFLPELPQIYPKSGPRVQHCRPKLADLAPRSSISKIHSRSGTQKTWFKSACEPLVATCETGGSEAFLAKFSKKIQLYLWKKKPAFPSCVFVSFSIPLFF